MVSERMSEHCKKGSTNHCFSAHNPTPQQSWGIKSYSQTMTFYPAKCGPGNLKYLWSNCVETFTIMSNGSLLTGWYVKGRPLTAVLSRAASNKPKYSVPTVSDGRK
ncbi:hypothetical protein ILYODFUR_027675 [Ilyodon furcidens]|uniref:Uncharacterized protein n=1 Tax=Ilyodon furcidens TaxID=33524 RepID=A0ABV0UZP1_9TELE